MDTVSHERRSANMAAIRGKNTKPEISVRKFLHARGFRYRLHVKELPGKPDIVFPRKRVVVFVHGCFWHGCPRCRVGQRKVKSNLPYWAEKLARNRERDAAAEAALRSAGWTVLTLWECEAPDQVALKRLANALKGQMSMDRRPLTRPRPAPQKCTL
jgi:DNA mismatch endonuclease (patch repair protein)